MLIHNIFKMFVQLFYINFKSFFEDWFFCVNCLAYSLIYLLCLELSSVLLDLSFDGMHAGVVFQLGLEFRSSSQSTPCKPKVDLYSDKHNIIPYLKHIKNNLITSFLPYFLIFFFPFASFRWQLYQYRFIFDQWWW